MNVRELARKINIEGTVEFDVLLATRTSYRVGGPADLFITPRSASDIVSVLEAARLERVPVFVLGGGANILVSDRGIRGIVLSMSDLRRIDVEGERISARAGAAMSDVSRVAAENALSGLGFIYSMPGSVGGSVWMNARCYGSSISDVLESVEYIDEQLRVTRVAVSPEAFGYKSSPFQKRRGVILSATFHLKRGDREAIIREMEANWLDRERKGHFAAPSAGSVFKNNHEFGYPTGKLIDSLGLRGTRIGGAKISDLHANIIVNVGKASAREIDELTRFVMQSVKEKLGLELEREVIPVGEW